MRLSLRGNLHELPARPLIMGIVNLSIDSFSGDGVADVTAAIEKARKLLAEGADIIDIGAESARTNRAAITAEEEAIQLRHFIEQWSNLLASSPTNPAPPSNATPPRRTESASVSGVVVNPPRPLLSISGVLATDDTDLRNEAAPLKSASSAPSAVNFPRPLLSINTWRPGVVRAVLPHGGDLLNDIGGLPTGENARTCADTGAALLIMHTVGEPKVPHTHVGYADIMTRLEEFFAEKIALAEQSGLPREALILDPGIDFAKQRPDNLRIYRELPRFHRFERPILLPVSRKTVIGEVLNQPNAADRDAGTIACIVQGILTGAHIFRVHNVHAATQALRTITAVEAVKRILV